MRLASMKLDKNGRKDAMTTAVVEDGPSFPYGLCLRLDSGTLDKLGISKLPKVGAKVMVQAIGVVTSVSQHESTNNDSRNVEIQLQEMGVESGEPVTEKERNELRREAFAEALETERRGRKA